MKPYGLLSLVLSLPLLLPLLNGCVSQDAEYIRRDINTLQRQIDDLQREITSTRSPAPSQPTESLDVRKGQADIEVELANLRRELSSLRANIEDNQHFTTRTASRLDELEKQVTVRLDDLEAKLDRPPTTAEEIKETSSQSPPPSQQVAAPLPVEEKKPVTPEAPPGKVSSDVEKEYHKAYEAFQAGNLDEAQDRFLSFLKKYSDTPLSDNAQFWIGEIHFKEHHYEAAILAYEEVINKYPGSNKRPDAILKQGLAFLELGDKIDARIILENLVKEYPKTEQARIARNKLKTLK